MIANGLEPSAIVKVEALRYLSLTATTSFAPNKRTGTFNKQRILVLGEYGSLMCARQLQLLEELVPLTKDSCEFMFRPHPSNPILQRSLPVGVSLSERLRVGDDLAECDVAFCSNLSSASLDAGLMGIPILMFRDGRGFNGSPLNDGPSVKYVNDATDMAKALEDFSVDGEPRSRTQIYPFYLDHDLERWRALLDSLSGNGSEPTQ
jgi:surface carbohydrate biosynthesis protein (TIGR04326 family)